MHHEDDKIGLLGKTWDILWQMNFYNSDKTGFFLRTQYLTQGDDDSIHRGHAKIEIGVTSTVNQFFEYLSGKK